MLRDLKVFQKTYDMFLYLHTILKKFPKSERFTLVQRIENAALDVLQAIIQANHDSLRKDSLTLASVELEKLRIFIRLSKDMKFISIQEYEMLSQFTTEIGRMIGGWIKSEKSVL